MFTGVKENYTTKIPYRYCSYPLSSDHHLLNVEEEWSENQGSNVIFDFFIFTTFKGMSEEHFSLRI